MLRAAVSPDGIDGVIDRVARECVRIQRFMRIEWICAKLGKQLLTQFVANARFTGKGVARRKLELARTAFSTLEQK